MEYQMGDLLRYKGDDSLFKTLEAAIKHAVQQSYNDGLWGIWTDQGSGSELLVIVYMQEAFHKK